MTQREVPYYTSDNEAEYTGHIWRQRQGPHPGGRWGFAWEVIAPYSDEPCCHGWETTQAIAEKRMNHHLEQLRGESPE